MKVLVSACLLGYNCKYNGNNNYNKLLCEFLDNNGFDVFQICPEVMGGLPTPRICSEIKDGKVFFKTGEEVTKFFIDGAKASLEIAIENDVKIAILKAKSPSCGCGEIYDGTFTGTLKKGNGITCDLFLKNGISVFTENDYEEILKEK